MMIYVSIILGVLALMALAILVKLSSILLEHVDGMMRQVMYVARLLQAVDHKVSKQFGWKDGDKEYIDELIQKEHEKILQEEQKEKNNG